MIYILLQSRIYANCTTEIYVSLAILLLIHKSFLFISYPGQSWILYIYIVSHHNSHCANVEDIRQRCCQHAKGGTFTPHTVNAL